MADRRTFFRSERRAWTAVALYTALLYSTLTVAFDLYVSIYDRVGRATVSWWMNAAVAAAALVVLLALVWVYRPAPSGYLVLVLTALAVAFCLQQLSIPAKRFHFFQYTPLTLLVFDACRFRTRGRYTYVWAMGLVAAIGLGDELLQAALPDRHFGVIDLAVNGVAGALSLAVIGLVVGDENYPLPERRPPASSR